MRRELKLLESDPPPGISAWPEGDSLTKFHAQIRGPEDSPYAKGIFKLEILIPERYPCDPPKIHFLTPIYHPNIDTGGRICLDTLKMPPKGGWTPSLNLGTVLVTIRLLMAEPNPGDGLMGDISQQYMNDKHTYIATALEWTRKHAIQSANDDKASEVELLQSGKSITESFTKNSRVYSKRLEDSTSMSKIEDELPMASKAKVTSKLRRSDKLLTKLESEISSDIGSAERDACFGIQEELKSERTPQNDDANVSSAKLTKRRTARSSQEEAAKELSTDKDADQLFLDLTSEDPFGFHDSSAASARSKRHKPFSPSKTVDDAVPTAKTAQVEKKSLLRSKRLAASSFSSITTATSFDSISTSASSSSSFSSVSPNASKTATLSAAVLNSPAALSSHSDFQDVSPSASDEEWECSKCTLLNKPAAIKCRVCSQVRPWVCASCRFVNIKGSRCASCKTNKTSSASRQHKKQGKRNAKSVSTTDEAKLPEHSRSSALTEGEVDKAHVDEDTDSEDFACFLETQSSVFQRCFDPKRKDASSRISPVLLDASHPLTKEVTTRNISDLSFLQPGRELSMSTTSNSAEDDELSDFSLADSVSQPIISQNRSKSVVKDVPKTISQQPAFVVAGESHFLSEPDDDICAEIRVLALPPSLVFILST